MSPRDKEILDRCHKMCVKSKAVKQEVKVAKVIKDKAIDKVNQNLAEAGIGVQFVGNKNKPVVSRNELMQKAKEKGIKYFRIMTKEELFQVLDHPGDIIKIQESAQERWKSGWGKNKKEVASVA